MDSQFRLQIHSPLEQVKDKQFFNNVERYSSNFANPFDVLAAFKHSTPRQSKQMMNVLIKMASKVKQTLPLSVYFMQLIFTLINSFQVILLFFTEYSDFKFRFVMAMFICNFIFMISVNLYLTTFKDMLLMTFLADAILLASLTSIIGFVGLAKIAQAGRASGRAYDQMLIYFVPILILVGAGHLRISFKRVRYTTWQIIGLKFCIYACAICYFMIGVYIMYQNWQATNGYNSNQDSKMKDFSLLFVFGSFSLYQQLCDVLCEFDQTAELKFEYEMEDEQLSQQDQEQQQQRLKEMSQMSASVIDQRPKSRQIQLSLGQLKKKSSLSPYNNELSMQCQDKIEGNYLKSINSMIKDPSQIDKAQESNISIFNQKAKQNRGRRLKTKKQSN